MDREHSSINCILEQAAHIAQREKEAAGDIEPTEGYKRRQIDKLIELAHSHNYWIGIDSLSLSFLTNFFIRINAHNLFFSNIPYKMIGFAYNSQHEFCAVLVQPYVRAKREATNNEIATYMKELGFTMDYVDEFHNENYEIFDAVPNNVLYGIDDKLYFIDTQIRLR